MSQSKPQNEVKSPLISQFQHVRNFSEQLCSPLEVEDFCLQSMPEASPVKWHLAHTSWFFETFLLIPYFRNYKSFHPQFHYLFNSYYNSVGKQFPRPQRGLQSRPTVAEVFQYRQYVDQHMIELLNSEKNHPEIVARVTLGIQHEQQHQELLLTDLKHALSFNPIYPIYHTGTFEQTTNEQQPLNWLKIQGGIQMIGENGGQDNFCFDNETPKHQMLLQDFQIADRLITNKEFLEFIEDEAYQQPLLWLSDGWSFIQQNGITKPLYWQSKDQQWFEFTLSGLQPLNPDQPVTHISFYEADAYARWAEARLLTEFEWEVAAKPLTVRGNFVDSAHFNPESCLSPNDTEVAPLQMFGDCWEWTQSGYFSYPGFKVVEGAIGEYNGKFMSNQMVLRGGSCVTSRAHIRPTYRNFFYPDARWQFSGIRLARDSD